MVSAIRHWIGSGERPSAMEKLDREFSNAPLRAGKGTHYEASIRAPLIVRWPDAATGGDRIAERKNLAAETPDLVGSLHKTLFAWIQSTGSVIQA